MNMTSAQPLKAPFPWFGGKSKIAPKAWGILGDCPNYVEPFAGSAAMLLARPHEGKVETINDFDGFVANFWRAVAHDPDAVAKWADWPVNENDLSARHAWLVNRADRVRWQLEDPDWYDAKVAGWWCWGICSWIGSGWCSGKGPYVGNGVAIMDTRQLPHLSNAGQGINRKLPHLGDAGKGINRQLPHLGDAGNVHEIMHALHARLRRVRVASGDWSRVCGNSVTTKLGVTGVFLDPPYPGEKGSSDLYATGKSEVFHEVAEWCRANGDNPKLRIILCGHEGDTDLPGWRKVKWSRNKGYGGQAKIATEETRHDEVMWCSPHCLNPELAITE